MSRLAVILLLCGLLPSLAQAQSPPDIRNPTINTESAEGGLIMQAGMSEDPAEKIKYLETFVEKYSKHEAIGYAYHQLQSLNLEQENYDKSAEFGTRLLKIVPNDVEVRHNLTKALEGKQDWDALHAHLIETKSIADKAVSGPKPASMGDAEWKTQVEYAEGVVQYIEYSLYSSLLKANEPAAKVKFVEALREHYPDGQYTAMSGEQLVAAYQQSGDYENMFDAMRESLAQSPTNESFLYTLAEQHVRKSEVDQAKQYAEQLLQLMEQKEKPEGQTDEVWEKHKALFTAYGNFVLGRVLVIQDDYRGGRALLLQTVDPLQEQGGENYGILAYFLGVCYVKLDIQGDNIVAARNWLTTAATTQSAYQGEAKKILDKIPKVANQ